MTAKFIEYGSTMHDDLERYFERDPKSLYDVYNRPSTEKIRAYENCLKNIYSMVKSLSDVWGVGVYALYTIRSYNAQIFTMIAKYETPFDTIYEIYYPTRKEFYIVHNP